MKIRIKVIPLVGLPWCKYEKKSLNIIFSYGYFFSSDTPFYTPQHPKCLSSFNHQCKRSVCFLSLSLHVKYGNNSLFYPPDPPSHYPPIVLIVEWCQNYWILIFKRWDKWHWIVLLHNLGSASVYRLGRARRENRDGENS